MGRLAAHFVKACNIRSLVFIATIWLMLDPPLPPAFERLAQRTEQSLLRLGMYFYELPLVAKDITVVHVPNVEYQQWLADLPGAGRLAQLLDKLRPDPDLTSLNTHTTGLILERPLVLTQPESESLLAEIQQGRRTKDHLFNETNALLARRDALINLLREESVVLGLDNQLASQYQTVNAVDGPLPTLPSVLTTLLWPYPPAIEPSLQSPVLPYAVIPEARAERQYLLMREQNHLVTTFFLQFLMASNPASDNAISGWSRADGIVLGDHQIITGTDASFVPLYGELSGIRAPLRQITLGAALAKETLSGWILVGRDGSESLDRAAQVLASLTSKAYIHTPFWWPVTSKAILLLLGVFICFLVPRIRWRWQAFLVPTLVLALATGQLLGQIVYRSWLPSGLLIVYLLFTFAVMMVWRWQRAHTRNLVQRADRASLNLADSLIITGQLRQAYDYARECRSGPEVYEKLYQIADRLESQHEWGTAVAAWEDLRRRKWRYRDVSVRLKNAKAQFKAKLIETKKPFTDTQPLSQTLAFPGAKSSPEQIKFGRYEVKREIGRGASGTVYLGYDPMISRDVAIKTVQYSRYSGDQVADIKARFFREAEAAGRLTHPNIVPVFDMGEEGDYAYIAMDFAGGAPLSHYVQADNLLPVFSVYRIALELAEALAYAHEMKIVHRDIKPGNVLFSVEPFRVRITDFGIARIVDHSHTRTGEILGSPLYMSPEQVLGKRVDFSSDIFSVGVMFYQLLTGALPFSGESLAAVSYEIVHSKHRGARTVRKELPASATRITNVCLQKNPQDRYQSAAALAEALRKAMRRDFPVELKQSGLNL